MNLETFNTKLATTRTT